jgi:hypothetical protein
LRVETRFFGTYFALNFNQIFPEKTPRKIQKATLSKKFFHDFSLNLIAHTNCEQNKKYTKELKKSQFKLIFQ